MTNKKVPRKASEVPVTQTMLYAVRNELKENFVGVGTRFNEVEAKFKEVHARFDTVDAKIDGLCWEMKTELSGLRSEIQRSNVLAEEQNAKNNVVLEALVSVLERQHRMDEEQKSVRRILVGGFK